MKLTDIIALAKQGYTPADIKELLTLATEETQTETESEASEKAKGPVIEPEPEEPAEGPQGGADPETEERPRPASSPGHRRRCRRSPRRRCRRAP